MQCDAAYNLIGCNCSDMQSADCCRPAADRVGTCTVPACTAPLLRCSATTSQKTCAGCKHARCDDLSSEVWGDLWDSQVLCAQLAGCCMCGQLGQAAWAARPSRTRWHTRVSLMRTLLHDLYKHCRQLRSEPYRWCASRRNLLQPLPRALPCSAGGSLLASCDLGVLASTIVAKRLSTRVVLRDMVKYRILGVCQSCQSYCASVQGSYFANRANARLAPCVTTLCARVASVRAGLLPCHRCSCQGGKSADGDGFAVGYTLAETPARCAHSP